MSNHSIATDGGSDRTEHLSKKVCLVSGAGRGLGEAAAVTLARQGATVVVNDLGTALDGGGRASKPARETVARIESEGGEAMSHVGDISSMSYAESLVADTVDRFGRIDGAVNFAGILRDAYLTEMSEAAWDQVIDVHLKGHFALLKQLASHWRATAPHGDNQDECDSTRSFVSVTSPAALGNEGQVNYAAAKAGVLGVTRTAAKELSTFGVRTNAIMPIAHTRMTEEFIDEEEAPPERVSAVVAYLLSDHAASLNGMTIRIVNDSVGVISDPEIEAVALRDGGWTVPELDSLFNAYPERFYGGFAE